MTRQLVGFEAPVESFEGGWGSAWMCGTYRTDCSLDLFGGVVSVICCDMLRSLDPKSQRSLRSFDSKKGVAICNPSIKFVKVGSHLMVHVSS